MGSNIEVVTKTSNSVTIHEKKRRVGLLGGGFNPVHQGHLIMADQVYHQLGLDEFYLMPSYKSPHIDPKKLISSSDRVEMLKLAIESSDYLGLELTEINREGKSYTYDTISYLKKLHPETDYYVVIGGDMVDYLSTWYKVDELMTMAQFVGVKRNGYKPETTYPLIWVDVPLIDISSTLIRKKVSKKESIKYLVPDAVESYINEKKLYEGA